MFFFLMLPPGKHHLTAEPALETQNILPYGWWGPRGDQSRGTLRDQQAAGGDRWPQGEECHRLSLDFKRCLQLSHREGRDGLSSAEMRKHHVLCVIPTTPTYSSSEFNLW